MHFIAIFLYGADSFDHLLHQKLKKKLKVFYEAVKRHPDHCSSVLLSHYIFFKMQSMMPSGVLFFKYYECYVDNVLCVDPVNQSEAVP